MKAAARLRGTTPLQPVACCLLIWPKRWPRSCHAAHRFRLLGLGAWPLTRHFKAGSSVRRCWRTLRCALRDRELLSMRWLLTPKTMPPKRSTATTVLQASARGPDNSSCRWQGFRFGRNGYWQPLRAASPQRVWASKPASCSRCTTSCTCAALRVCSTNSTSTLCADSVENARWW